jgi:hypothetical protein
MSPNTRPLSPRSIHSRGEGRSEGKGRSATSGLFFPLPLFALFYQAEIRQPQLLKNRTARQGSNGAMLQCNGGNFIFAVSSTKLRDQTPLGSRAGTRRISPTPRHHGLSAPSLRHRPGDARDPRKPNVRHEAEFADLRRVTTG